MATTGHTVKAFDDELIALRGLVAQMGGMAEKAIGDSLEALRDRDLDSASRIVAADKDIDALEAEVERQVATMIALRAPMADDLRDILAALKIASTVERMGDYAKNIARRVPLLADVNGLEPLSILPAMGRLASEMVRDALNAFAARDGEAAAAICQRDRQVDDFYNSLFRTLLTHMMENPHTISACAHLLFIAKNLERIGDHATNICEMVFYAATGAKLAERAKGGEPA